MPCGQSFFAWNPGIAERTPNLRASYDADVTTPRALRPPDVERILLGEPFQAGQRDDTRTALRVTGTPILNSSISVSAIQASTRSGIAPK